MVSSQQFRAQLGQRASAAGVLISENAARRLEAYFRLLALWNEKINLTSLPLTPPTAETVDRLFIEPFIAATYIRPEAGSMIDIGSGGGSPAVPLAIAAPRLRLRMLESKTRKSVFLREAARVAELTDAEVVTARLENAADRLDLSGAHDLITIRAVRLDKPALQQIVKLLSPTGQIFLFGSALGLELAGQGLDLVASHPLRTSKSSELSILRRA
jgi:16S rRNA (guanine527-N7)-methyltransferase